ncbi:hypothetical protein AC623_04130 [Bacillus sp. FJAT-27231]|uniref:IucA/IucC family C-terminal-domain containing protein n=1 Tax=Bacillus sp. FJAT-27231 TaxID=1679168 RepID=UPI000670B65F|nr:IucA/IucC family C-terminal-domain containing protein [Bacillus sp. FJAT-27231]KMY53278.1 hypothetical protein AC623_04130 [Bacillus sp. FJAT-27231]
MNSFTNEEMAALEERYRFTKQAASSSLSIQTADLLEDQRLYAYLIQVKEKIEAANTTVAASLFIKRYSFAVLIALYSMSSLNKKLDFSFKNVCIETLNEADTLWLPSFRFNDLSVEKASSLNRSKWREEIVQQVFSGHVDVLFTHLKKHSKLSKLIMWENLYTYIRWMYQNLLDDPERSTHHDLITEDFHYIVKEGTSSLFGSYHQNPFFRYEDQKELIEKDGKLIQKRKTCCLSYLAGSKGKHCSICPIVCKRSPT